MNKNRKIKLGWLFPHSGVFNRLKSDLQQGFELGLDLASQGIDLEVVPQFIQTGGQKETEDALKRLLLYEEVDMVMGVVGTKVALTLLPLLQTHRIPLFLLNLGADLPTRRLSSDFLFYNSLHLWKSQWVMGRWAQEKYGGEPSINISIYEGGYSLHDLFRTGTAVSGAVTVKLNTVKNVSDEPDTAGLLYYIKEQRPTHVHALLSGKEGQQFLQLFAEQEPAATSGLSVNPFMVEDGMITSLPGDLALYNASTWSLQLDTPANLSFVRNYTAAYEASPTAFSLLAYEAGLGLTAALSQVPGRIDGGVIASALGQTTITGPRGRICFSTRPLQTNLPVYIRLPKPCPQTGKPQNHILETTAGIEWNVPGLSIEQSFMTGWQNPYLCV